MATGMPPLEFALIADGVPMDKLYPLDIDRAFKSMSRIRSAVPKFWDTGALSSTMLADNEVGARRALEHARRRWPIDQGAPIGIQWNQNMLLVQAYGIPVGAKNARQCQEVHRLQLDAGGAEPLARQVQGDPRQHQVLRAPPRRT